MGAGLKKSKNTIKIKQTKECPICNKLILKSNLENHIVQCEIDYKKKFQKNLKKPKHNTPNLNLKMESKIPYLSEEDLYGYEYSPEVFESNRDAIKYENIKE